MHVCVSAVLMEAMLKNKSSHLSGIKDDRVKNRLSMIAKRFKNCTVVFMALGDRLYTPTVKGIKGGR